MLLLVGLGNPGSDYAATRHNIGAMWLDAMHSHYGFPSWQKKFQALFAQHTVAGQKILLLKPQTYMNLSGQSVLAAATFFKLKPAQVLAVHDELDLPLADVRQKQGGSDAGHNGLKSITATIGPEYHRLRLGIGRPEHKEQVSSYVLHPFTKEEQAVVEKLLISLTQDAEAIFTKTLAKPLAKTGSTKA